MDGYAGTLLRVNLSDGTIRKQPTPPELAQRYLGGRGLGAYLLYTEVPAGADPLGPDNKLIASTGPLSGTLFPGACKMDFAAKSPAGGGYGSASIGGKLAAELKFAGYDAVIVEGASERPVYLLIDDGQVELRDAGDLWGLGSLTVEQRLKAQLGEAFQIATIGPAGENRVRYACISHDIGRQAGRCGMGAVMGSKRLKALAVRGSGSIPLADPAALTALSSELFDLARHAEGRPVWVRVGTMKTTEWTNATGTLPTRNFQAGSFEQAANLNGEAGRELVVADKGCFTCPAPCGKVSHLPRYGVYVEGPDYETVAMLGSDVGLGNMEDVARANWLCDELGLDTISAGGTIAWAMECYEKGLFSPEQLGGLDLPWGSAETVFTLLQRIAAREGWLGDLLAEGSREAARRLGGGSDRWAIQVKGVEQSAYDTHSATAMLLAYMTSDIGGHHGRAWAIHYDLSVGRDASGVDKAAKVIELQHVRPLFDCWGVCRFLWVEMKLPLQHYVAALRAVTGIDRSMDDLLLISERVWNLTRLYWAREQPDFGRAYDAPPARFVSEPATCGPTQGEFTPPETIEKMLDDYYRLRGWDENGFPSRETLERLDLLGLSDLGVVR